MKTDADRNYCSETFTTSDLLSYGLKRWRRIQYLANQFWLRYRRDYLSELQSKAKWTKISLNLKAGDLVLLKEKNTNRLSCRLSVGLIKEATQSDDGLVRKVTVRTVGSNGQISVLERHFSSIVLF
jgi:hypothetical protein